jgi:hypothetical protein
LKPVSEVNELLQLTANIINKLPSLQNVAATNVSMTGISFISGGYYFVNVLFTNNYNLQASFLRFNVSWLGVYAYLHPPTQTINVSASSNSLPSLTLMTSTDVTNDKNLLKAYS